MERLIKDCLSIQQKNKDLNVLFINMDKIIDIHLVQPFNPQDFFKSLAIIGGEEVPRVLIYCLRFFEDVEDFDELENEVDPEFISNMKFIVAKYSSRFRNIVEVDHNPLGWKNVGSKTVTMGGTQYLDIEIELNNNEKYLVRDEPHAHLDLVIYILRRVKEMQPLLSNDKLDDLYTGIDGVRQEIQDITD